MQKIKRFFYVSLCCGLVCIGQAMAADLQAGLAAYERQDYQTALVQLMQLAEAGDANAQYIMGRMFGRGEGVVQDFVEAHKWFNLASSKGHVMALPARAAISERMNAEQLAEAQQKASNWRPLGAATANITMTTTTPITTPTPALAQQSITAVPPSATVNQAPSSQPSVNATPSHATTQLAMTQLPAPPSVQVAPAEVSDETLIANIQLELKRVGYGMRIIDGKLGGQTRQAIKNYQLRQGLAVTGTPSPQLLTHLRSQLGSQPTIRRARPARIKSLPLPPRSQRLLD